jgi:serine/threonine-protein phosphatase 6 regulatory ankyrin repeat subunit B
VTKQISQTNFQNFCKNTKRTQMCEASALSVALFKSMHALACAEAQLHEKEGETCIVSALDHAMRVAHASCEAALTRVDPLYDAAICDAAEYALCKAEVASALENAKIIVFALEYASTQSALSVDLCGDAAMRAAIFCKSIGAVALGVVLLSEFDAVVPPRGLFLLSTTIKSVQILRVLLLSPALVAHINDLDEHNNTVLMNAVQNGYTDVAITLLQCPAVCKLAGAVNSSGNTALMLASMDGHAEFVEALLACPAVIEFAGVVDTDGETALMLASRNGYTAIVNALIACPAVIESAGAVNKMGGNTALMIASQNGHTKTVLALLACPAVIESAGVVDTDGDTALMIASQNGHTQTVQALLACPAVIESAGVVDTDGDTALSYARTPKYCKCADCMSCRNRVRWCCQ